jgi:hypothetical protein
LYAVVLAERRLEVAVEGGDCEIESSGWVEDVELKGLGRAILLCGLGVCVEEAGTVEVVVFEDEARVAGGVGVERDCFVCG